MIESIFPVWERVLKQVKKSLGAGALGELQAQLDQVIALSILGERKTARLRAGKRDAT
jgi:hypothetical protein